MKKLLDKACCLLTKFCSSNLATFSDSVFFASICLSVYFDLAFLYPVT